MNKHHDTTRIAERISEASGASAVLYLLRCSRVAQAMELLEQNLDSHVVLLSQMFPRLDSADRKAVLQTLKSIREYRRLFPDRPTADMESIPDSLIAKIRDTQEKASSILDELAE